MRATVAVIISVFTVFYLFPWAVAWSRQHHQTTAIFVLNLLLGWTIISWVGALVWAATRVERSKDQMWADKTGLNIAG
jgi:Superinfection immunity protein